MIKFAVIIYQRHIHTRSTIASPVCRQCPLMLVRTVEISVLAIAVLVIAFVSAVAVETGHQTERLAPYVFKLISEGTAVGVINLL